MTDNFVFVDNKYIGIDRISTTKIDINYFAPNRSQWLEPEFRLDQSKQSGTFILSLFDVDLDTWAYPYMPKMFRWQKPTKGGHFDLDIREGESPNNCKIIEKYSYCYVDPDSEEWKDFIMISNTPKLNDEPRLYKFLIAFEDFEKIE